MQARVYSSVSNDFRRGLVVGSYFYQTVRHMNHKLQSFETGHSPCKIFCDGTVTISDYVFCKDHVGNFLYSYMAARTSLSFGMTVFGGNLASELAGHVPDTPDDQAAYTAGYAHGQNPTADFKSVLESKDINAMQSDPARRGWPSPETATGRTYPTWGATHGGLTTPD